MELWAIWLIIGLVLFIVEMLTLTFYLLWLGVGAFVAAVVAFLVPDLLLIQTLSGCAVAILLTLFTKPLTQQIRNSRGFKDVIDELVGKQGLVIEEIPEGKYGIVKIGNETWTASSHEFLPLGQMVIVTHRGNTIIEVQKWGGVS
ncbi:membrane protein implicated in regulation of membrane protease activity [Paenibacillus sp. DS2015]|uniref:NfeD family protein n=1 Tax=Paenibacillus sp. DS2015 TaxID=3373917 RepID=UPI003D1E9BB1